MAPTETIPQPSMSSRAREVRRMFSDITPTYDRLNHLLSLSIDRLWRRKTVREALRAADTKVSCVLDVCAGTGDLALAFRRALGEMATISAVDFAGPMLRVAREKSPGMLLSEADALHLPFADGRFDIACMAFGLRNLADPPAGLREMARTARRGGQVVVLEFSRPRSWWLAPLYWVYLHGVLPMAGRLVSGSSAYRYLADTVEAFATPEEVRDWMRNAGLVNVRWRSLTGGIVVLYQGVVK